MKFLVLLSLVIHSFAFAGNELGNGGNHVYDVCTGKHYFYDTYEMEKRYSWRIQLPEELKDEQTIALEFADRFDFYDKALATQLKGWIKDFYKETNFVDKQFPQLNDYNLRVIKENDIFNQLIIQKPVDGKMYAIYRPLWARLDKIQRAVAILHEVIYRRSLLVHSNLSRSDNIRLIVQLAISDKLNEQYIVAFNLFETFLQNNHGNGSVIAYDSGRAPVVVIMGKSDCH